MTAETRLKAFCEILFFFAIIGLVKIPFVKLDKIISGIDNSNKIEISHGKVKLVNGEFKIRRNILIGSSDFRLITAA